MFYLVEHNRTTSETHWWEFLDYQAAQSDCFMQEQR